MWSKRLLRMLALVNTTSSSTPTTTLEPRRWLAMIPMMLGVLIGSITISAATTALPAMQASLGLSSREGLWIIDVYPLTLAATLVLAARAGDRFGRRTIMLLGLAGFAAFNLIGGLTSLGWVLIVSRVGLGASEAMVISSVVATIGVVFHQRERVLAYGLWTAAFGSGTAFGPVAGGLLADGPGWPWVMLGCVPIALVSLLFAALLVPQTRTQQRPHWDMFSIVTSIVALAGVVYALQHAVSDPVPAALIGATGIICGVLFTRRQLRLPDPLIDVQLFRIPAFGVAYVRILAAAGAGAAVTYLVSVHFQEALERSPVEAGLALLPQAITIAIGGVLAPLLLRVMTNPTATTIGLIVAAVGVIWLALAPADSIRALSLVGAGGGVVATLAAAALFDVTTPEQAGQVGAVQEVGFALGNGLGVAVFGTIALTIGAGGFTVAHLIAASVILLAALVPLGLRR